MGNAKTERRKREKKTQRERDLLKDVAKKVTEAAGDVCPWWTVYRALRNRGEGDCAMLGVFLLVLRDGGMDAHAAQEVLSLDGASPDAATALANFMLLCRQRIVEYASATGQAFYPTNGPHKTDEEIEELIKSTANIGSQGDWEILMLLAGCFLDEFAVLILAKLLGLPDIQIVQEIGTQLVDAAVTPADELGPPLPLGQNLLLHRPGSAHFEALGLKVKSLKLDFILKLHSFTEKVFNSHNTDHNG